MPSTAERFIGEIKSNITATKDPMTQAGRNFILRYHTAAFMDTTGFSQAAMECLHHSGYRVHYDSSFKIHHVSYHNTEYDLIDEPIHAALTTFIRTKLHIDDDVPKKRVGRLQHLNVAFVSASALGTRMARQNVQVNDTYIRVNEDKFGEIQEIVELPTEEKFLVVLREFKKIPVIPVPGLPEIKMPRNHYPFAKTTNFFVFEITRTVFVQKGCFCHLQYNDSNLTFPCVSFRPNEWFNF
jgi:hypothetical protein